MAYAYTYVHNLKCNSKRIEQQFADKTNHKSVSIYTKVIAALSAS